MLYFRILVVHRYLYTTITYCYSALAAFLYQRWSFGVIGNSAANHYHLFLARYDPFGVDVPLNCDTTTTTQGSVLN